MHPILDHPLISTRYFFPRHSPIFDTFDVKIECGILRCWRSAPASERPVLIHFHGNGEVVHDWIGGFCHVIEETGFDVFLAEYRGYGGSDGVPQLVQMFSDFDALAAAIGVPQERIVPFGRSVGSIYAIEWIDRFPLCPALILESGIHDVAQRLRLRVQPDELECTAEAFDHAVQTYFDQPRKLKNFSGDSLVLHAQNDHLVGLDHAVKNAACLGADCMLKVFPRGDHNSILAANVDEYMHTLTTFLARISAAMI